MSDAHLTAGLRVVAKTVAACLVVLLGLAVGVVPSRADTVAIGNAANFGLLFEGAGGNTLQVTNVTVNGNVGVGNTGVIQDGGPSTINGTIYFSAANTGQFHNNNAANVFSGPVYNSTSGPFNVTGALNTVNALNTSLGGQTGTNIAIGTGGGQTLTINASAGKSVTLGGVHYRVFTVTGFNTTNSNVLTINGDATGDAVVLNFTSAANFNNQVALSGLSPDQVLYNFVGGSSLTGGPTLQINTNASSNAANVGAYGVFLDPNGAISVVNANVFGRVFGGDTHDFQYVSGATINAPQVPEPSSLLLCGSGLMALAGFCRRRMAKARRG